MLRLGAHESIAGGLFRALERASEVGCECVQIWTKNSRQWRSPPLTAQEITQFKDVREQTGLQPVVAHAAYLINIASPKPSLWQRSVDALIDELQRCVALEIPYLVLHPGSSTTGASHSGQIQVIRALHQVQQTLTGQSTRILLETTAGQGHALGGTFEELATLLQEGDLGDNLGVCLDTCHVFAAGYDIRTPEGYAATMAAFDAIIGLDRLAVIHLNDSKHPLGSHKDRHEHIGEGHLGLEGFRPILSDPRLEGLPGIIETPKSDDLHEDRENLARLRKLGIPPGQPAK
ncbi:MAG TPA: deoxyribonuclease IV [Chloroflexi bacterium]|nr:deoxyribonuclease IV [Chloroflexota bacterium]